MYLKSLVLKGFKSFADRSVLTLEPGITAVVGPNGSGKSNICDAVLWVLGELNAKHLRGQAMEDVIFAGSSARKQVGMAEVDLVLDNADGTLPIEYEEVVISRRMYRSGESEYLINGSMARRMDVLDILHDTGLGTGTHSIISQGNLESVLQSRPEDRRALIEEAAGVLKHKQRKARSERKLAAMDENLTRVRDIAAEVERQLGPLERKAQRARTAAELKAQLADLDLSLAVEDLRGLQRAYRAAQAREQELSAQLEERRQAVGAAQDAVGELQEQLRRENVGAGELAQRQRKVAAAVERLDGAALLLGEKRRAALDLEERTRATLAGNEERRAAFAADEAQAQEQLAQVRGERAAADAEVARLACEQAAATQERRRAERETEELERAKRDDERDRDKTRRELSRTQEALATGMAHARLVAARRKELELELGRTEEDASLSAAAAEAARAACEEAAREEAAARAAVSAALTAREEARAAHDAARDEATFLASQIKGLEEVDRAARGAGSGTTWALEHAEELRGGIEPFAHAVRVPQELEALVERLLGSEVSALLVDDAPTVRAVAGAVAEHAGKGEVVLVARRGCASASAARAAAEAGAGEALLDALSFPPEAEGAVASLLGDVVVCAGLKEAFAGHERFFPQGVRFATRGGCVVWPSGKVTIGCVAEDGEDGVLARARRLEELRGRLGAAEATCEEAKERAAGADAALSAAQRESLSRSQALAELRGRRDAAQADAQRAGDKLARSRRELADIDAQQAQATQSVEEARPAVEELEARLAEVERRLAEEGERLEELQAALVPLRRQGAQLRDALAEAKLTAATLAERETYTARVLDARVRDLAALAKSDADATETLARKRCAGKRAAALLADLEEIEASAKRRLGALEDAALAAQGSSSSLQAAFSAARERSQAAHAAFDEASEQLSAARVEEGRLEERVQAAVNAIVQDCGVPLDHALSLPAVEDRAAAEQAALKLRRRIANLGAVSPEAIEEHERVKKRYDYLSSQLADLESARRSLQRIVRAIDARMKDDFLRTFEEVDRNFQEIFAVLFPGGSARLSLVDPDDPENSGVEVSAQPRGKRITKMSLMSGGEKSLTALALLFAVYRTRSTPFYILDEVEAALDDSNLRRLIAYLDELRGSTQLIMITHQRRTMEMADVLFGVSMQADGVTKVISQKLDRALQYAE